MTAGRSNVPRVVITGIGVVSPVGIGREAFWQNLLAGRTGIGLLKRMPYAGLPCKLAAEIEGFDPHPYVRQRKLLKVMSRDIQLGVSAATLALRDSRLASEGIDPDRLGVVFGAGQIPSAPHELADAAAGCLNDGEFDFGRFGEECLSQISPLWLLPQLPNMPACHIAIEHDARGPNNTLTCRDASPLLALAEGVHTIQRGVADAMIVGGCGSDLHAFDIARLALTENLSHSDDPRRACRPFDIDRDGCVLGEGAAAFVIENYEFACRRGAPQYAEVLAAAAGCDGQGQEKGAGGIGLVRAVQAALRRAQLEPAEIGHINAHGKATRRDDLIEAQACHLALGSAAETIPVTGLKSYFGTFDAGTGAVELAGCVLSVTHGMAPFTLNHDRPDPHCRLNVIHHEPLRLRNRTALSVNRTAMGQSAAAIIRAV
ncbi:MAG: beta-ketoacyl-[acyl-carrier-protein] synthase family protein [Planctomycetaceae bacterium]